jgi:hypothetical protein
MDAQVTLEVLHQNQIKLRKKRLIGVVLHDWF